VNKDDHCGRDGTARRTKLDNHTKSGSASLYGSVQSYELLRQKLDSRLLSASSSSSSSSSFVCSKHRLKQYNEVKADKQDSNTLTVTVALTKTQKSANFHNYWYSYLWEYLQPCSHFCIWSVFTLPCETQQCDNSNTMSQ